MAMAVRPATPDAIADAGRFLRQGGLVAFPTETVYGLGADATNDLAVAAIFSAKGRPAFNPLIVHVPNVAVAARLAKIDDRARRLSDRFWPGPLTLVLRQAVDCPISRLATAGLETVAIRCPAHPVALALIQEARTPIAAPSANRSGHVSPTTAAHVRDDLGGVLDIILDGGPTEIGLESTVLDLSGDTPVLLRAGGVATADLDAALGRAVQRPFDDPALPASPGMLAQHYAPRARVRLEALDVRPGEALLAFGPVTPATQVPCENLSVDGDVLEAAANLFAALRRLDASGVSTIAVMPIPKDGLGEAINDRLRRAAADR
jgi:L-threonylcarbamoyladenylate synthase